MIFHSYVSLPEGNLFLDTDLSWNSTWPDRTPQLFINYRMKSVAYLPWKRFIYSFLLEYAWVVWIASQYDACSFERNRSNALADNWLQGAINTFIEAWLQLYGLYVCIVRWCSMHTLSSPFRKAVLWSPLSTHSRNSRSQEHVKNIFSHASWSSQESEFALGAGSWTDFCWFQCDSKSLTKANRSFKLLKHPSWARSYCIYIELLL